MFTAYIVVTILAAAANLHAASNDFRRAEWILASMTRLGVPLSQLSWLGWLKVSGALGLLVGIGVPAIGVAAAAGLTLFFVGAVVTAMRARWYAHLPVPAVWLLLAVAALVLRLGA
jgi:hypothetical protein